MKKIIIFKEKYGNRYFDASTDQLIDAACTKILKQRCEEYDLLPDNLSQRKTQLLDLLQQFIQEHESTHQPRLAYKIMKLRQDYEYEGFEIVELEQS